MKWFSSGFGGNPPERKEKSMQLPEKREKYWKNSGYQPPKRQAGAYSWR